MISILIGVVSICVASCGVLPKGISYFGEDRVFGKSYNKTFKTLRRDAENWQPAWELGIAIQPHKDGRIKGVRIKNPTFGNVRLSVWDADTRQLLKTINVNINDTINYN